MLHIIKKVEYLDGYNLILYFDDKSVKTVDLGEMLKNAKNMFLPLVDTDYFKKVECDGTTICWPNGVDLCPDVLYSMGKDIDKPAKKRTKRAVTKSKVRKNPKLKTA